MDLGIGEAKALRVADQGDFPRPAAGRAGLRRRGEPRPKAPEAESRDRGGEPAAEGRRREPQPIATYRVQLRNGVDLGRVASLAPYLARLGVSHVYLSPILTAAPGSAHGYDVADPTTVDDSLGGRAALADLERALNRSGLGIVFDIVPNHMAAAAGPNRWFTEVLALGRRSPTAPFFDIDWSPSAPGLSTQVVLPILGGRYGDLLQPGTARLSLCDGGVQLQIGEGSFPISTASLAETLAELGAAESRVEASMAARRLEEAGWACSGSSDGLAVAGGGRHREETWAGRLQDELDFLASDPRWLDRLLQRQHYRLVNWRAGARCLNYRRFFDVDTLIGLRMEDPQVYRAYHELTLDLVAASPNAGLRVDHPDGLLDPRQYLERLRADAGSRWIVVEKILAPGERLPASWPVEGTTGYDFSRLAGGLLIDRRGEAAMTKIYRDFTNERRTFAEIVRASKAEAMRELFAADLDRLTRRLLLLAGSDPLCRDFSALEIGQCLVAITANLPVYRTYLGPGMDERELELASEPLLRAAEATLETSPDLDPKVLAFVRDVVAGVRSGSEGLDIAMRYQQLTGAVMAKGVEDTAFYRYNRLISLNEVGDDPACFGVGAAEFHTAMRDRQERSFSSMSSTSTHDSKRAEDARCRLNLLTHLPKTWGRAVRRWHRLTAGYRGPAVDPNFEYLFFQMVFGAWPISEERLLSAVLKSAREAKVNTSWRLPRADYEGAVLDFARSALRDPAFAGDLQRLVDRLSPASTALSLSLCLLKLTAPGVPDIYQGSELWDLSLVDPDNRRPVDFPLRSGLLRELEGLTPQRALGARSVGLPKLWVTATALQVRRQFPTCFGQRGSYHPVDVGGTEGDGYIAFVRGRRVATVAAVRPPAGSGRRGHAELTLPPGTWINRFTGDHCRGGRTPIERLVGRFPVALLTREAGE